MRETTLCYIEKDNCYLMLHRTKDKNDGSFDKWLGVGGKFEKDESPEECLLRECLEETGYSLISYNYRGKIYFYSDCHEDEIMHLYTASEYSGELISCNEGELTWIDKFKVLDLKMWEGDKIFLKRLLEDNNYFELELRYNGNELISYKWL